MRTELVVYEPDQLHWASAIDEGKLSFICRRIFKLEFILGKNVDLVVREKGKQIEMKRGCKNDSNSKLL